MEEEKSSEPAQGKKGIGKLVVIIIIALVVIAAIAGFVLFKPKNSSVQSESDRENSQEMMMEKETPTVSPSTSASPSGAMTKGQTISITGKNYRFNPSKITVKKDEEVTVNLTSEDMPHDFVIDELNVKSSVVTAGKTTSVTFTPTKAGTYEFYCSVGNHRAMGMVGQLIVQ